MSISEAPEPVFHECEKHDLSHTHIVVVDKHSRVKWTSRDPSDERGHAGMSTFEFYPKSIQGQLFDEVSKWIIKEKTGAYVAQAFDIRNDPERSRSHNLKVTMLPFDYGELAGLSLITLLPDSYEELSEDDFTLLRLLASDRSLKEISSEMDRSKSAVNARIKALKQKLGCKNIGGLVAIAVRYSLI